jgi:hypothetical protein
MNSSFNAQPMPGGISLLLWQRVTAPIIGSGSRVEEFGGGGENDIEHV